ncbi:MAG: lysophospholipid acyltransferase family protein [Candidatus Helarchaeota archaeon]
MFLFKNFINRNWRPDTLEFERIHVEHVALFDKLIQLFAGGRQIKRFNPDGTRESFIWPYSFPFIVRLTKWLDRHQIHRYTMKRKGPLFWLARAMGFLFGGLAIYFSGWTDPVIHNIKFIYKNRLKRYDEKTRKQIFKNIIYRNCRYMARLLIEDLLVFPSYVHYKNLKDRDGMNLEKYRRKYEQYYELKGKENLDAAFEKYGGAILLYLHTNSFILGSCYFGFHGYNCIIPIDSHGVKAISRYMKGSGQHVIDAHDPKIKKKIDRYLKNKKNPVFISTADMGYPNQTLLPFFSELCRTPVGPAVLAQRYNLPVLPMWEETHPKKFYHTLNIGKEIDFIRDESVPKRDRICKNSIKCNKEIEKIILKDPAKWCLLSQVHNIRRFNPVFEIQGLGVNKMLLKQLESFKITIKESYEENRQDDRIIKALERSIESLKALEKS